MTAFGYWVLFVFVAYFAVLIGIAIVRARHMDDMSDYVLGGRRMGTLTSALSSASSAASGWTMLVFPALAFAGGLIHLWTAVGIALGHWLVWTLMGRRLRRYTVAAEDSLTIPEFFEKRFMDRSGTLRTVAAVITVFFIVFYVSSGLIAGAKLLEEVFAMSHDEYHWLGVLITLAAITTYTFIGGFLAVSRTDVFQSLMMLGGFILLPLMLIVMADDPFRGMGSTGEGFWNPFTDQSGEAIGLVFVLSSAGWGLGALGSQRMLARLMAVDREDHVPRSRNIGVSWVALMFSLGLLLGLIAVPALTERGLLDQVTADPERVYLVTSTEFFHPLVAGLLLTAVIAAVMSTADSQLLLASAIMTSDVPLMTRLTDALRADARVWLGRAMLLVVGGIAALLSIEHPDSVFNLVSLAWGGMGAAFGPATLLALYWRRFNYWGALTSITVGTAVATLWWYLPLGAEAGAPIGALDGLWDLMKPQQSGIWSMQPATPGFLAATPAAVLVTLLTPPPNREVSDLFEQVNGPAAAAPVAAP
ncbi:MAG: sodium/proline symporter [Chloroflexi bacterium]|nr:sodium/proline symporter [Chloroflexota bacterium]